MVNKHRSESMIKLYNLLKFIIYVIYVFIMCNLYIFLNKIKNII